MSVCTKCGHDPDAVVVATWTLLVPRSVQSGNANLHNKGSGRFSYRHDRDAWAADVRVLMHTNGVTKAKSKRRVTLTRLIGFRQRAFDRDNLAQGLKPCMDALVRCGALVDDSPIHAEVYYAQERRDGQLAGLRVVIEELS